MQVFVNAQSAYFGGGIEYLKNQLYALRDQYKDIQLIIWTNNKNYKEFVEYLGKDRIIYVNMPYLPYYIRFIAEQILCPFIAKKYNSDVIYLPGNVSCFFTLRKQVVVFQNPNLFFNVVRSKNLFYNLKRIFQRFLARLSMLRADRVIFISKNLMNKAIKGKKEHYYVLYSGVNIDRKQSFLNTDPYKPYILAVSNITYHKNYPTLLKAFEIVNKKHPSLNLVIAGKVLDRKYFEKITSPYKSTPLWKKIHFLDGIKHEYLGSLYSNALCYITTTILEAFPLTPFEAMYFGTPVVVSSASSLPEICKSAAIYIDPHNPTQIANTISLLIENPEIRREYIKRGKKHIQKFTWKNHAKKLYFILTS